MQSCIHITVKYLRWSVLQKLNSFIFSEYSILVVWQGSEYAFLKIIINHLRQKEKNAGWSKTTGLSTLVSLTFGLSYIGDSAIMFMTV